MSYTIVNPTTGHKFSYYSDRAPTALEVQRIINTGIQKAENDLSSGRYKKDRVGRSLGSDQAGVNLAKNTSLLLGVPEENVDAFGGANIPTRLGLGIRPSFEGKLNYLRDKYGYDNVSAVPVDGKYRLLVQTGGSGKDAQYSFVNEEGISAGDFAQFGSGSAIPIVAATGITMLAPVAIPAIATGGWASSAALAALSGAGYFGAASAQDAFVRAMDNRAINAAEIAKRRAAEALIGFFPEAAFLRAGGVLASFGGREGADKVSRELIKSTGAIRQEFGAKIKLGAGGLTNRAGIERDIASTQNSAAMRKLMQDNLDELDSILQTMTTAQGKPLDEILNKSADNIRTRINNLKTSVGTYDEAFATQIETLLQRRLQQLGGKQNIVLTRRAGEKVQDNLQKRYITIRNKKRALYDEATELADFADIVYDVDSVLNVIRRVIRDAGSEISNIDTDVMKTFLSSVGKIGVEDEAALNLLKGTGKFRKDYITKSGIGSRKLLETLTYRQLDDFIKRYAEKADFTAVGGKNFESSNFAKLMRKELVKLRDKKLFKNKKPINAVGEKVQEANKYYRDEYLAFSRADVAPLIKPDFGGGYGAVGDQAYTTIGGEAAIKSILQSGKSVDDVIARFPEVGDPKKGLLSQNEVRQLLREQYMAQIGLNGTVKLGKGIKLGYINADVIQALYGGSPALVTKKVNALKSLENFASMTGKEMLDTIEDKAFRGILSAGTPTEINNAIRAGRNSIRQSNLLEEQVSNKLFKGILDGTKIGDMSITDAMEAIGSLLNKNSNEIKAFVKVVQETSGESGMDTIKNRLIQEILEMARPKGGKFAFSRKGNELFDPNIMLEKLNNPKILGAINEVLGNEWAVNMRHLSNVLKYSQAKTGTGVPLRPVVGTGTITAVAGDLFPSVGRFVYGKMASTPGLKKIISRKTPEETAMAFSEMLTSLLLTKDGLKSLIVYAKDDPEMSVFLQEELANLSRMTAPQSPVPPN